MEQAERRDLEVKPVDDQANRLRRKTSPKISNRVIVIIIEGIRFMRPLPSEWLSI